MQRMREKAKMPSFLALLTRSEKNADGSWERRCVQLRLPDEQRWEEYEE
jgi:hypothetical protein